MSSADDVQPVDEQAYQILRTRTCEAQAITAGELSEKLQLGDGQTSPAARELVGEVMQTHDLPIVSSYNGYWVAESKQDLERYLDDLRGRKAGIQQRMQQVTAAFNRRRYDE